MICCAAEAGRPTNVTGFFSPSSSTFLHRFRVRVFEGAHIAMQAVGALRQGTMPEVGRGWRPVCFAHGNLGNLQGSEQSSSLFSCQDPQPNKRSAAPGILHYAAGPGEAHSARQCDVIHLHGSGVSAAESKRCLFTVQSSQLRRCLFTARSCCAAQGPVLHKRWA